jgi:hypothetical protein
MLVLWRAFCAPDASAGRPSLGTGAFVLPLSCAVIAFAFIFALVFVFVSALVFALRCHPDRGPHLADEGSAFVFVVILLARMNFRGAKRRLSLCFSVYLCCVPEPRPGCKRRSFNSPA